MNLKKILSSALASTMLLSVVSVSAMDIEYEIDGSDVIITTEYVESDAVSANGATVKAVAEKKTAVDDEVTALGRTWKKYIENSTADVYKITYKISDFGMFANGYDDVDTSYFGLYDMTLGYTLGDASSKILNTVVPTTENVASVATLASTLPDGTAIVPSFGVNSVEGILSLYFQPSTNNNAGQAWPKANVVVKDGTFTLVVFAAVETGATLTLKPTENASFKKMNYAIGSKQYNITAAIWTNTNITMTDLVVGASDPVVEDKPVTMDTPVAGNDMYGMKTALTEITFKNVADPVVKLEKDGVDSGKTYELPAGVKGGETAIIGIIRYAADVTGTFVLKVLDGTTEVASTTYVAE